MFIFLILFKKKNLWFLEGDNSSEKVVIVEEELDGIDINDIGNLEDSPSFVLIDEECENVKVVNDGEEVTRNFNQKKSEGKWTNLAQSIKKIFCSKQTFYTHKNFLYFRIFLYFKD